MRKHQRKWRWAGLVVLITMLAAGIVWLSQDPEPTYGGKPLSEWILLRNGNERAMLHFGPKAVPQLIRFLHAKDSSIDPFKEMVWARLPQFLQRIIVRPVTARHRRDAALYGFLILRRSAREAFPDVLQMARHHSDPFFQMFATMTLMRIAPDQPETLREVLRLLRDGDRHTFNSMTLDLRFMAGHSQAAVPVLTERIVSDRVGDQPGLGNFGRMALTGLRGIGSEAKEAVPHLIPFLKGSEARAVLQALAAIAPDTPEVIPALESVFARDPDLRTKALQVFVAMEEHAAPALPFLKSARSDENGLVRVLAAYAVGKIEQDWASALPVLIAELTSTNRAQQREYWEINPDDAFGTTVFAPKSAAAFYLGQIGPDAQSAAPALLQAAQDRSLFRRIWPAHALWRIQGQTNVCLPALIEAINERQEESMTVIACRMLAEMGSAAQPAVVALLNLATNTPFEGSISPALVHDEAVAALRQIQPEVLEQIPVR